MCNLEKSRLPPKHLARLLWLRQNAGLWEGRILSFRDLHNLHSMMQVAGLYSFKSDSSGCRVEQYIHRLGGKTCWNTRLNPENSVHSV